MITTDTTGGQKYKIRIQRGLIQGRLTCSILSSVPNAWVPCRPKWVAQLSMNTFVYCYFFEKLSWKASRTFVRFLSKEYGVTETTSTAILATPGFKYRFMLAFSWFEQEVFLALSIFDTISFNCSTASDVADGLAIVSFGRPYCSIKTVDWDDVNIFDIDKNISM